MLVIDSFRGHLIENVKAMMRQKCGMVVIPGGMAGMLQPLDVSINRPFKAHLRRFYRDWRCSSTEMTPTGWLKKPSLSQMCQWIVAAWNLIPAEMVSKSFKVTSISNVMDGTEDDATWLASSDSEDSSESNKDIDESSDEQ